MKPSIAELCRKVGMSYATYKSRRRAGLSQSEALYLPNHKGARRTPGHRIVHGRAKMPPDCRLNTELLRAWGAAWISINIPRKGNAPQLRGNINSKE